MFEKLPALARRDARDDGGAVINGELGMSRAERARDALNENLGVGFNEYCHVVIE